VDPTHIVPVPLHLYLGINNKIIFEVLVELLDAAIIGEEVEKIKTKHTLGHGGLSDVYSLNGPEIRRWIKREVQTELAKAENVAAPVRAKVALLTGRMKTLHGMLLHDKDWTSTDIWKLRQVVDSIHQHWKVTTGKDVFPKLHMLHHAVQLVEKFKFLGRVSESRLELSTTLLLSYSTINTKSLPAIHLSGCDVPWPAVLEAIAPFVDKPASGIPAADAPS
jgi:hypothetical protein